MNGQASGKSEVSLPASNLKLAVCEVLKEEGYISGFSKRDNQGKAELIIALKYYQGVPVIDSYNRISKPSRRVYRSKNSIPSVLGGLGIAIVSTSEGVMTGARARERGHGGEVLCVVS
jgi:small subunit ribosomal protein S8